MSNNIAEKAKADTQKAMSDVGNKIAHAKADVNADMDKIKANFGHDGVGKDAAYVKADIKAGAAKAKADVDNKVARARADFEIAKADIKQKKKKVDSEK